MTTYLTERIAIDQDICNGRPIIRGMRITVQTVLEFLLAGTKACRISILSMSTYPTIFQLE
ncbi:DUF433 domain-containing protein [Dyadobacter sp. CY261]|uniref:DUF433 domain-containing protein n=1 Tax=Dyadobacter sp. CY261 TaxID=2907203 RepID=UPI00286E1BE0|nr:DUF433 domain-containing protein [Dyadobacter sp. CY261]